jgi:hypothetical protein
MGRQSPRGRRVDYRRRRRQDEIPKLLLGLVQPVAVVVGVQHPDDGVAAGADPVLEVRQLARAAKVVRREADALPSHLLDAHANGGRVREEETRRREVVVPVGSHNAEPLLLHQVLPQQRGLARALEPRQEDEARRRIRVKEPRHGRRRRQDAAVHQLVAGPLQETRLLGRCVTEPGVWDVPLVVGRGHFLGVT